jgi:signal transduction histidine kinase
MCEVDDLRERRRQALEIHDNIVQGLAEARLALQLDERQQAEQALTATLAAARDIITDLLDESGDQTRLGAGDLRRSTAVGPTDRAGPQA